MGRDQHQILIYAKKIKRCEERSGKSGRKFGMTSIRPEKTVGPEGGTISGGNTLSLASEQSNKIIEGASSTERKDGKTRGQEQEGTSGDPKSVMPWGEEVGQECTAQVRFHIATEENVRERSKIVWGEEEDSKRRESGWGRVTCT